MRSNLRRRGWRRGWHRTATKDLQAKKLNHDDQDKPDEDSDQKSEPSRGFFLRSAAFVVLRSYLASYYHQGCAPVQAAN
jgi:hypothetical protein